MKGSAYLIRNVVPLEWIYTTLAFCLMHIVLVHRCQGLSGQQASSRANRRAAGAKTESAEPFEQPSWRAAASVSSGGGEMVYSILEQYFTFKYYKI